MKGDGRNKISLLLPNESRIVGLPSREMTVRGFSAVSLLIIDEAARVPDMMFGESSHSSGYSVPKRDLITGLQVLFESRKFQMPDTPATEDLIHELAGMRAKPSRTGNWRYEGSSGRSGLIASPGLVVGPKKSHLELAPRPNPMNPNQNLRLSAAGYNHHS